jgi:hypothetical protein
MVRTVSVPIDIVSEENETGIAAESRSSRTARRAEHLTA